MFKRSSNRVSTCHIKTFLQMSCRLMNLPFFYSTCQFETCYGYLTNLEEYFSNTFKTMFYSFFFWKYNILCNHKYYEILRWKYVSSARSHKSVTVLMLTQKNDHKNKLWIIIFSRNTYKNIYYIGSLNNAV